MFTTGEGNSASATPSASNNIDKPIVNKPKRNKTARSGGEIGLQKRISKSNIICNINAISVPKMGSRSTKSGLLFFSNAKKVGDSANSAEHLELVEGDEETRQQSSSFGENGVRLMSGGSGHSNWKVLSSPVANNLTKSMSSSLSTKLNERVQVIRTPEEREESSESIRMDGMGLKAFPLIGGGEGPNLKLLSLQKNLISKLESVPSNMSHLVVLDLYDNRVERITGLQGMNSLRVLLLGKNR